MSKTRQMGCFLMLLGALALPSLAQNPAPGSGTAGGGGGGGTTGGDQSGGGSGRGGRGGFDPAQFRQRMLDGVKEALGATDEEFKALSPKIEQISALQRDLNGNGMRILMRGGRGGGPGGGADRGGDRGAAPGGATGGADAAQPSVLRAANDDLQKTLDDKNAKPEDVKAKLAVVRQARVKAKADLAKLQDDLKSLLTSRQEAVCVELGLLE